MDFTIGGCISVETCKKAHGQLISHVALAELRAASAHIINHHGLLPAALERSILAEALQLPDYASDARSAVKLDYITYALQ